MRIRSVSSLAISMIIVGCTRPAPIPHRLSVEDIIHKVHCELRDAVWDANHVPRNTRLHSRNMTPQEPWWGNWKAKVQLQIQTARDAGLSGTADFTTPIHRGKFSLGLIAGFNKKATNSNTFNFDVYMDELGPEQVAKPQSTYTFNADRCTNLEAIEGGRSRLLAGNLGLTDWLQRAAAAYIRTGIKSDGHTYFVEFVITHNGSAKPGFNITSPTGETYAVTITAGGKRVKTHKLTVTLARDSKPGTTELAVLQDILKTLRGEKIAKLVVRIKANENRLDSKAFMEKSTTEINTLKGKIESDKLELNRLQTMPAPSPSARDADSKIRQLQILDALGRINTNN